MTKQGAGDEILSPPPVFGRAAARIQDHPWAPSRLWPGGAHLRSGRSRTERAPLDGGTGGARRAFSVRHVHPRRSRLCRPRRWGRSHREPVAIFTGEVLPQYAGELDDRTVRELLDELAGEMGRALEQEEIHIAYSDRTWTLTAELQPDR